MSRSVSFERKSFIEFRRDLSVLESARAANSKAHGGRTSGDTVEVDYFALGRVIEWSDEAMDDYDKLVQMRDILELTKAGSG